MQPEQPQPADQAARIAELENALAQRTDQLLASTARAYSFLDSINKGFVMCDTGGELVLANDAIMKILAAHESFIRQETTSLKIAIIDSLLQPGLDLTNLIKECIDTKQTFERDNVVFGKQVLHLYITPLMSSSKDDQELLGVIILVEDITELKMLDRSKDEFLSIASHELRTPLTAIRGNTSIIQKYYAADIAKDELKQMVADIHESSVRLIGIVNDFLDVAALEQGKIETKLENFVLNDLAAEASREMQSLCATKNISLVCHESLSTIPQISGDRARIKQIVINLIGNAIKFTDNGSITLSAAANESHFKVYVTDTGKGMSEESQKLLFRKFQQAGTSLLTRDTSKGTGLGLYISKLIVEIFHGTIELEKSELNVGSTFAFTLPLRSA